MEKYLTDNANTYTWNIVFYFTVLFIVRISADLMDFCLVRCARNLVLFWFYFSTVEITNNFRDNWCNFQVTYSLYLHIKLWCWFEIYNLIKPKDYNLNRLKNFKYAKVRSNCFPSYNEFSILFNKYGNNMLIRIFLEYRNWVKPT